MITVQDLTPDEIECSAIRAGGPGGQNVNKVSTAIHLRFDIRASSLPELIKERLLAISDQRVTADGMIVIKAQKFRSQEKNRLDAYARLDEFLIRVQQVQKTRRPTRPSRNSVKKRLDGKSKSGARKKLRGKIEDH